MPTQNQNMPVHKSGSEQDMEEFHHHFVRMQRMATARNKKYEQEVQRLDADVDDLLKQAKTPPPTGQRGAPGPTGPPGPPGKDGAKGDTGHMPPHHMPPRDCEPLTRRGAGQVRRVRMGTPARRGCRASRARRGRSAADSRA